MIPCRVSSACFAALALLILSSAALADGPKEKIVYTFQSPPDAGEPFAALIADANGNLYGTSIVGGASTCASPFLPTSCGTVYTLTRGDDDGTWKERILYSFQGPPNDGSSPAGSLIMDRSGNLYGVTPTGGNGVGSNRIPCSYGCGTVFELSPPATEGGAWTKTTLYNFQGTGDGAFPDGSLTLDESGNLYGVTNFDGIGRVLGNGIAFRLSPASHSGGTWTETILYRFGHNGTDAAIPVSGLIFDKDGNLYGASGAGGVAGGGIACSNWPIAGCGTIYRLSPPSGKGARWQESVLYRFQGASDQSDPTGKLAFDHHGRLYGVNAGTDLGTVFQLSPTASDAWSFATLYTFQGGQDGSFPQGGIVVDESGNVYGTTFSGGGANLCLFGCGTIYQLSRRASSWHEQVLHRFGINPSDGLYPEANLLLLDDGRLFGNTTSSNGGVGGGVVFEYSRQDE